MYMYKISVPKRKAAWMEILPGTRTLQRSGRKTHHWWENLPPVGPVSIFQKKPTETEMEPVQLIQKSGASSDVTLVPGDAQVCMMQTFQVWLLQVW